MGQKGQLLIVDDDQVLREMMGLFFRGKGYFPFLAENGEKALSLLEEEEIDLVISDYQMPGIGGRELVNRINKSRPFLPIILITGRPLWGGEDSSFLKQIYDYYPKPVDVNLLEGTVAKALQDNIHPKAEKETGITPVKNTLTANTKGDLMGLIVAENLSKDYQVGEITVQALRGVSFTIEPASFVSFVGPSGSGKTTLLNLIGCLDKPTQGNLKVAATDVARLDRNQSAAFRGNHLGFIFQDFNLIPVLTVFENIEYPLLMVQKVAPGERKKRVLALLAAVGMSEQKDKYPDQISGGQKQRVAVARALVTNPKLVLADEPTANLDHATAFTVINLMKKMKDEMKTTFVFSTHDQKIVGEAEVIYSLEDGQLVDKKVQGRKNNG